MAEERRRREEVAALIILAVVAILLLILLLFLLFAQGFQPPTALFVVNPYDAKPYAAAAYVVSGMGVVEGRNVTLSLVWPAPEARVAWLSWVAPPPGEYDLVFEAIDGACVARLVAPLICVDRFDGDVCVPLVGAVSPAPSPKFVFPTSLFVPITPPSAETSLWLLMLVVNGTVFAIPFTQVPNSTLYIPVGIKLIERVTGLRERDLEALQVLALDVAHRLPYARFVLVPREAVREALENGACVAWTAATEYGPASCYVKIVEVATAVVDAGETKSYVLELPSVARHGSFPVLGIDARCEEGAKLVISLTPRRLYLNPVG